ncbi:hypothetical protein F4083_01105 [Candidatus Poribacteria bacterium]|nr:hypothetical protein [Candidatus Poribacteria bacterium]MYF54904.1 hypothetical protein [Candidatus Poribacteria bacterium]MYI92915.1 hypothetical protein [Candidatus Poribacteria bacterium]
MYVPVKSKEGKQLMPTTPPVARHLIKGGKATPYWSNGIFCIRLNYETSEYTQEIAVGVDPGSKKEGFTVKSMSHTYLNVQADAHKDVGKKVEKRSELRKGRRSRKCPNRKNRTNRLANKERVPAGTRARWDWKLRILDWLSKLYPITHVCVEDIKARTIKKSKKWNTSFSPLEVGKSWFYSELQKCWQLLTLQGWETKEIRDRLGLKKSSQKLAETFDAHCVDSWCLAYHVVSGDSIPDNLDIFCISPIPIRRRELHRQNPQKGGKRPRYGGTMCLGTVKNTLVKHVKHRFLRVTGYDTRGGINLSEIASSKRIVRGAKSESFRILTKLNFQYR